MTLYLNTSFSPLSPQDIHWLVFSVGSNLHFHIILFIKTFLSCRLKISICPFSILFLLPCMLFILLIYFHFMLIGVLFVWGYQKPPPPPDLELEKGVRCVGMGNQTCTQAMLLTTVPSLQPWFLFLLSDLFTLFHSMHYNLIRGFFSFSFFWYHYTYWKLRTSPQ